MSNINDEYYLVVNNYRNEIVPIHQVCDTTFWKDTDLIKPLHYAIDDEIWQEGIEPRDIVMVAAIGILIKDYLKDEFFHKFNPDKIKLQPAYITSPDGTVFFEGYWVAMANDAPAEWLDVENSVMAIRSKPGSDGRIYRGVKKFQLNTEVMEKVPLKDRLFFNLPHDVYGTDKDIIHRSLVEYMGKIPSEHRDVAFVPISDVDAYIDAELPASTI